MRAIAIYETGSVDTLKYIEVEDPIPASNEVLISVNAIGINPVDYKVRMIEEVLHMICGEGYPAILGWDIAGTVESVGSEVTAFNKGDKVFGMVNFPGRGHAYAEKIVSPESHLALMPDDVSFEDAAATTLAALTALQVLETRVKSGDTILIHAGSGGVGHFAIQIAKHLGAKVITTCSEKNREFVLSLSADQHIDYKSQAFEEIVSDIDFILDSTGDEKVLLNSIKSSKRGGVIISIPSPQFSDAVLAAAEAKNIDLSFLLVQSSGKDMNTLRGYLESGVIKAHVSKVFIFEAMAQAHTQLESNRTVGKVVVRI